MKIQKIDNLIDLNALNVYSGKLQFDDMDVMYDFDAGAYDEVFLETIFTGTTRFTGSICILRDSSNVSFERIEYSFPYLENIKVNDFNIDETIPEEFESCTILERV